jgi:hypothetical protein
MRLAILLVVLTSTPGLAAAQPTAPCALRGPIEAVERSTGVARVEITSMTFNSLEVIVLDQFVGSTPAVMRGMSTPCWQRFHVGDAAIVMNNGTFIDGAIESLIPNLDPRVDLVLAVAQSNDRAREIIHAIADRNDAEADAAALFLATSPQTLGALTRADKRRLVAAARKRPTRELALALSRLRIRFGPKTYDRLGLTGSMAQRIAGIRDFESITDFMVLSEKIANEPDVAHQYAAFERCERILKPRYPLVTTSTLASTYAAPASVLSRQCKSQLSPPRPPPPMVPRPPTHVPAPPPPPATRPRTPTPLPVPPPSRTPVIKDRFRDTDLINPYRS